MIPRNYTIFGLILLCCLAGLVLVNLYIFKPELVVDPFARETPPVTDRAATPLFKGKLEISSKEKTENDNRINVRERGSETDVKRENPFLWPEEIAAIALEEQKLIEKTEIAQEKFMQEEKEEFQKEVVEKRPKLSMVIIGESRKMAMLDNNFFYEGEQFNDNMTVYSISKDEVVLLTDIEEIHIPLENIDSLEVLDESKSETESDQAKGLSSILDLVNKASGDQAGDSSDPEQSVQDQVEMINTLFDQLKPFLQEGNK